MSGRQLVNTRVAWGSPLPVEPLPGDKDVLETKKPYVSDVIVGAVAQEPLFTITVPVIEADRVGYFLNLSLPLSRLTELMTANLEAGRRAGLVDRAGYILARSERAAELAGTRAAPTFFQQTKSGSGVWRGRNNAGELVRTAFARASISDWTAYVSTPEATIQNTLRESFWAISALGVALTAAALLIAYAVGGRLARSMRSLATEAGQLGRGEPVVAHRLPVSEINDVGNSIAQASVELMQRERERDKALEELRRLSESLEKIVSERTHELVDEMGKREQAEEALRQAQKMEAIGQLTGGIAHDFNNMLAVVLGNIDLAKRRLAKGMTNIDQYLTGAHEGGKRAAALTQRLLAFARQQPLAPEPADANKLVGHVGIAAPNLGEPVRIETVLTSGLWRVHADPNQLENAILNLAVNARDAMPDGGKLTIETLNAQLDDHYAAGHAGIAAGQYVMIAVTDTGTGMNREVIAKAFDPFFTTKKSGVGTGLGLSQVYGFVKQSGGHVKIYSEAGDGTTIKIYLPRYFGAAEPVRAASDNATLPTNDGSVSILVVEDEEGVRRYSTDALRDPAITCAGGRQRRGGAEIIDAERTARSCSPTWSCRA